MGRIYWKCTFCGKKKHPNTFEYCSNDCRRDRKKLSDEFWENKPEIESMIAKLLDKKPMTCSDLSAKLMKHFKKFKINKYHVGRMLTSLITTGKIRIYPYRIGNRTKSFCYIRSNQREEAFKLYCEYVDNLPPEIKTKAYLFNLEMRKITPEILKLWDKNYSVERISKETKVSVNRIKELIVKMRR